VGKGTFVMVGPPVHNKRKIQIVDISMGGLAFIYDGSAKDLKDSGVLSLLAEDKIYLNDVHYDTVSDSPVPASRERERDYRKKAIRFAWLGFLDKSDLESFITDTSIGEL
jgi:hypothetical protein